MHKTIKVFFKSYNANNQTFTVPWEMDPDHHTSHAVLKSYLLLLEVVHICYEHHHLLLPHHFQGHSQRLTAVVSHCWV